MIYYGLETKGPGTKEFQSRSKSQMTKKLHQNELLMAKIWLLRKVSLSAGKSVSAQGCKNFADCQVHNNSPLNKLLLYIYLSWWQNFNLFYQKSTLILIIFCNFTGHSKLPEVVHSLVTVTLVPDLGFSCLFSSLQVFFKPLVLNSWMNASSFVISLVVRAAHAQFREPLETVILVSLTGFSNLPAYYLRFLFL